MINRVLRAIADRKARKSRNAHPAMLQAEFNQAMAEREARISELQSRLNQARKSHRSTAHILAEIREVTHGALRGG